MNECWINVYSLPNGLKCYGRPSSIKIYYNKSGLDYRIHVRMKSVWDIKGVKIGETLRIRLPNEWMG